MKTTTTEEQSKTRWPATAVLRYSQTVIDAAKKLTPGTVDEQSQLIGMHNAEPLLVALDAMLKYATEYRVRYEAPLANDSVMGEYWLDAIKNIHGLLNGDGAVAMKFGSTTDSKSNGVLESIYWAAIEQAGFKESDL